VTKRGARKRHMEPNVNALAESGSSNDGVSEQPASADSELGQLTDTLEEPHSTIQRLRRELARANLELDHVRIDRDRLSLLLLDGELSTRQLDCSVTNLTVALAERDSIIESILASRSWRATAFLRWAKGRLMRLARG
jgi:hypothetical protein